MGIFDIPAPLFTWFDNQMSSVAPATLRLILWGVLGGVLSMALYWALSPQRKIERVQTQSRDARQALDAHEGEFSEAMSLIRDMLRLALKQVGVVAGPAIIASLPLLFLIVWLSTAYGNQFPAPGAEVEIQTFPEQIPAQWIADSGPAASPASPPVPRIVFPGTQDGALSMIPLPVPVTTIHKHQWWNVLFGNPAGYLPDDAAINRVKVTLPEKEFISFGPSWLRSWEAVFFTAVVLSSLAVKIVFRIK